MGLSSLLSFISFIGLIMLLAGGVIAVSNMAQNRNARGGVALALIGLVVAALFYIASVGLVEVTSTQVAVVYQRIGGDPARNSLWPNTLRSGVHIIAPVINEPIIYSIETRNYTMSSSADEGQRRGDDAVEARTSDGQLVKVDVAVFYNIDPAGATILHVKWQNRYENDFVRPTARSIVRQVLANYAVSDIYSGAGLGTSSVSADGTAQASKLPQIEEQLFNEMAGEFTGSGLNLQRVLLREITFSEEFIRAIENRQVTEQQAQQAKLEADRKRTIAQGEADAAVTAAQGEAKSNIERARGDAEATVLRAEADAKALDLISQQLQKNPLLVQWRYIERLAQNVRMILVPSNSPYLFDLNSLQAQAGANDATVVQPTATPAP
jgi:regulator of protease activity HflC (stomatin/prohibitin superfamily)